MGPLEEKLITQAKRQKMPLPDKIKNKPEVKFGLDMYWRAFNDLSGDRDIGMGIGPIPWRAIHDWASRHQIHGDDFDRLVLIIRGLDGVFMEKQSAKSKKKMGANAGKGKGEFKAIGKK